MVTSASPCFRAEIAPFASTAATLGLEEEKLTAPAEPSLRA